MISASIVIFNSTKEEIETITKAVDNSIVSKLYIVDNSSSDAMRNFIAELSSKTIYIHGQGNVGFGAAHNIAIKRAIESGSNYHLILNPDICFEEGTIEKLKSFMDVHQEIGLVMPKIIYPDGETQYLCKMLPTPVDLIFRRFFSFLPKAKQRKERYELRGLDYLQTYFGVPSLSGCFMFFRTDVLIQLGGFDERFFMYMEDLDLCRRTHQFAKTAFFPEAIVTHCYEKGSYKSLKLLKYHIVSAVKYFNKWGWFFDRRRIEINKTFKS